LGDIAYLKTVRNFLVNSVDVEPALCCDTIIMNTRKNLLNDHDDMPMQSRIPAHYAVDNFLSTARNEELLQYMLSPKADYRPTTVYTPEPDKNDHSPEEWDKLIAKRANRRKSQFCDVPGDLFDHIAKAVSERFDDIVLHTGVSCPKNYHLHGTAVAHSDGHYFQRHSDVLLTKKDRVRMISVICYLHGHPKNFQGGELRLYSIDGTNSVDIIPKNNSAIFFPSVYEHEVLTTHVQSGDFKDSRFAFTGWMYKRTDI